MDTINCSSNIQRAAEIIKNGGIVAVPTETVYGLAGNGLDDKAVSAIYEVKGRPQQRPLSLMVHDKNWIDRFCVNVPEQAVHLAEKFWPGPLTLVLKSSSIVPLIVRAGGKTVGLRCPDHKMTIDLIEKSGLPLAAPSANPFSMESPKDIAHVLEYFNGKIDGYIDGGECKFGLESTLIDMSDVPFRVLRQGALSQDDIEMSLLECVTVVGITGGTGSGKTTLLKTLEKNCALTIDADAVYHRLLRQSKKLINDIGSVFPDAVIDGNVDTKKLGSIVFNNPDLLETLNCITHPAVVEEITSMLRRHAMNGGTRAAIDAIALFESGLSNLCSITVAVTADNSVRRDRISSRDNIGTEYADSRIKSQKCEIFYTEKCDYCISNNGSIEEFNDKIESFLKEQLKWKIQ